MTRAPEADEERDFYDPLEDDFDDADSILGAPVPTCTWPTIGTSYDGVIIDVATGDQRNVKGETLRFQSGQVRRQVILTLQTRLHDDADDDGRRRLFVKGAMVKPFREAIAKAKAKGPRPGGKVVVKYVGDGEKTDPRLNPPKLFTVTYKAPAA